jgi:hypothetical protein
VSPLKAPLKPKAPAFDVDNVFAVEFDKAIEAERLSSGYEPSEWQAAGRWNDQGEDYWRENGAGYARNFIDWYESRDDVRVWIAPDGVPAIELDMTADFGSVSVRGVVDLVLAIGAANPALVVVDIKSGSTRPHSARQLAIGASLVEARYGIRPRYGAFFMARKGQLETPVEMGFPEHSIPYLGNEFRMFDLAANSGIFPANPGDHCRRCPVAYACAERGGPSAGMYDPNLTPSRRNTN